MSFWSGLAAAGVAIALAFVAFGQPAWEYERVDSQTQETWTFSAFVASQTVFNTSSGLTTWRNYSYDQLAGLPPGRAQPHVAKVFGDFQQLMILALIAAAAPQPPPPPPDVEPVVVETPEPRIEEVFVIGSNGLLIKHMCRTLMTDKDRDVVGSMISAISSFVREAFTERDGEVHEVSLGDHRFVMCNEAGLVVAVLVTSGQTEDIVHRLKHLLVVLRDRYGERPATWQGEPIEGIEDELGAWWDPYPMPRPPLS